MVSKARTSSKNNTDLNGEEYRNDSSQQMNRGAGSRAGSMGASARGKRSWRIIQDHFAFDNLAALSFEEQKRLFEF